MAVRPVMLIILDGWGLRAMEHGNAPLHAHTPNHDAWDTQHERSVLGASEEAVGLTPDQMGNSEVGHLNLGAGRIVYQDISRIDQAIRIGELAAHPQVGLAFDQARAHNGRLHLIGLVSSGGVHSHINHLLFLLEQAAGAGLTPIVHIITDGRDTPPNSGAGYVEQVTAKLNQLGRGAVATVSGRYYAMDRDNRWERTGAAYDAMTRRVGEHAATAADAIQAAYAAATTDEFIKPTVIGDDDGLRVQPGDAVFFYNFRPDRMRQLVRAFTGVPIDDFTGQPVPNLYLLTMTRYADDLETFVVFDKDTLDDTLAETLSRAGLRQYHTAETEKYPHVTYFFNGRNEQPFPHEDWHVVPSPKVATYDLKPEMSAYELTEATLNRLQTHDDDFILINFANPDMVGHTGIMDAAVKACAVVDECAGRLVAAVNAKGGVAVITADHGNCDRMVDEVTGGPHTYHTTQPVALYVIGEGYYGLRPRGVLADVAPTVLHLLGVEQPTAMDGRSLILHAPGDSAKAAQ